MTKLKNTKKGMAKKALSISLVAAMLATSNVPVWAAEFTDGSDAAVEAPVVEEPAVVADDFTAEAVEETVETPALASETTGAGYELSGFKFGSNVVDNKIKWADDNENAQSVTADFTLKGTENATVNYVWKVDGTSDDAPTVIPFTNGTATVNITPKTLSPKDAGKSLQLYVYAVDNSTKQTIWSYTSDAVAVEAIDNSEAMKAAIGWKDDYNTSQTYDGEEHKATKDNINFALAGGEKYYDISLRGDFVNVTDDGVKVTVTDNRDGYKGSIELNYQIKPMVLDGTTELISDHFVATLKTTNFVYTGNVIRVKASDVTVTDKNTKADLSNYLEADENGYVSLENISAQSVGETTFKLNLIDGQPETGIKNYKIIKAGVTDPDGFRTVQTDKATVTARDLSTVNVKVQAHTIPSNGVLTLNNSAVYTFTDAEGNGLNLFNDLETVTIKDVTKAGTYTAVLEPKAGEKDVIGKKEISVTVVAASLAGSKFTGQGAKTAEEYTGDAVTKTEEQLGQLQDSDGKVIDKSLYEVVYKDNVNAGTAKIIVKGKGDFTGSEVEVATFQINPAEVTDKLITANERVEYKDTSKPEDYAKEFGLVVKAKNAKDKEFTLTEGKDYNVEYSFDTTNDYNNKVKATITITNKNFIKNGVATFTKETTIDHKAITSENIKLRQTSFTYTGKAIVPEFDIVIDGKVINPDFFTPTVVNNINAGTATLTVKGDGKNYSNEEASVTFTINPADINSLEGVIASKEYTGYSLTLAEEDFNLTLNKDRINVKDNFTLTYGTNVEIGEGTVTLTPKNGNFTGSRTFTFQITGELLNEGGLLTYYDENGIKVQTPSFDYDGTAKEYAKTVFAYNGNKKLVEGTDYEIKYVDNVYGKDIDYPSAGKDGQHVAVLVIAKGKYGSTKTNAHGLENGVYTDAAGNKIANVMCVDYIKLNQQPINKSNVSVSNGTYAAGLPVKPNVDIVVNGVVLKEGQDYDLKFEDGADRTKVTASNSLKVTIEPKNGYKVGSEALTFFWGIDKFNLANAEVSVDGDKVVVKCGRVDVEASEYTVDRKDNTLTVTAVKDSKNYTGSKTIDVKTESEKPGAPMIVDVEVKGNNATVILEGDTDGATGYDYVISKDRNCITNKDYDKVNKNILTTDTTFTYTQQGTYYAYCHAWKRVNGKKVFSDWSNAYPFVVSSITPEQPAVTNVKVSGSTVKVTYTKSANATGYDLVLGKSMKKVNGEMRPVEYGKLVKKVYKGNTVTATFTKVPKGSYYVGLHAYNRTSEDGKKVFSTWSNAKKITVK